MTHGGHNDRLLHIPVDEELDGGIVSVPRMKGKGRTHARQWLHCAYDDAIVRMSLHGHDWRIAQTQQIDAVTLIRAAYIYTGMCNTPWL